MVQFNCIQSWFIYDALLITKCEIFTARCNTSAQVCNVICYSTCGPPSICLLKSLNISSFWFS